VIEAYFMYVCCDNSVLTCLWLDSERISRLWLNIVLLGECMILEKIDVHVFLTISRKKLMFDLEIVKEKRI